jgi:spore coat polysaccharide biosynthesis protein SpsF
MIGNKKVVAIIQSRVGSTRLPKKCALPIPYQGKNYLTQDHIAMRLREVNKLFSHSIYENIIDDIIFAFPYTDKDIEFVSDIRNNYILYKQKCKIVIATGIKENDVINRVLDVANKENADIIIEITADCPFIDPKQIAIMLPIIDEYDYISNVFRKKNKKRLLPDGLDVQIYKTSVLKLAQIIASNHENNVSHVGYNIVKYSNLIKKIIDFKMHYHDFTAGVDYYSKGWSFTLDEVKDYRFLRVIANQLKNYKGIFGWEDLKLLLEEKPELLNINKDVKRKNPNLEA